MQAIHRFSENYIEPIVNHKVSQIFFQAVTEIVKIIAAKIFLEYLGNHYLNDPKKISKQDVHAATVLAPLHEEAFFRFGVLKAIHIIQQGLDANGIQIASNFYGLPNHEEEKENCSIVIYPPLFEEMLCRGYMASIYAISTITSYNLIEIPDEENEEKMTEEEKIQQVFRIHLGALIFAAAHLANPHPNKTSALIQFSWTFLGGIIYGYLFEKYNSLAPSILAHGFNNSLAIATQIYPQKTLPFLLTAIFINRISAYLLAVTCLDKIVLSEVSQVTNAYFSLFDWKKQTTSDEQIDAEEETLLS